MRNSKYIADEIFSVLKAAIKRRKDYRKKIKGVFEYNGRNKYYIQEDKYCRFCLEFAIAPEYSIELWLFNVRNSKEFQIAAKDYEELRKFYTKIVSAILKMA